jgi:hypothetical protein
MEKLLFKKGRKGFRRDFIAALNPSLFRYAPLHKEGFNNSKQYLGLKKMCKFESGLISNKCKLFLGRVNALSCAAASVPLSAQRYQTKPELAARILA